MVKRRTEDLTPEPHKQDQETNQSDAQQQPSQSQSPDPTTNAKSSAWVSRFGSWSDFQAGVHLIEDRQNRRMLIKFDEKPSEEVRALLKSDQFGYRFDPDEQLWYKKLRSAAPRQSREEAEQLAFQAANLIRQEKGLELREAFSVAM